MTPPNPQKVGGEYGDVRATIDLASLNRYLVDHCPFMKAPVQVKQFKFGQSNPTYFLTDSTGRKFVLRKKPPGKLVDPTAHKIEREYKILRALHTHNTNPSTRPEQRVPVPEPFILCENSTVVGTPFYIMEYLEGRSFTDANLPELEPAARRECWLASVRALAALHSTPLDSLGLSEFSSSKEYFPRQIKTWSRVSAAQSTIVDVESQKPVGKIPSFDDLVAWYQRHLPDESKTGRCIVHGDYKLDNLMFHPTENRVIGILDWELCTTGSPLADLGNLTLPWIIDMSMVRSLSGPVLSGIKGFKNSFAPIPVEDLEREYCRLTNWPFPICEMVFARSFMMFRLSVISQGIAARYAQRQASSEHAWGYQGLFSIVGEMAKMALEDEGFTLGPSAKL